MCDFRTFTANALCWDHNLNLLWWRNENFLCAWRYNCRWLIAWCLKTHATTPPSFLLFITPATPHCSPTNFPVPPARVPSPPVPTACNSNRSWTSANQATSNSCQWSAFPVPTLWSSTLWKPILRKSALWEPTIWRPTLSPTPWSSTPWSSTPWSRCTCIHIHCSPIH